MGCGPVMSTRLHGALSSQPPRSPQLTAHSSQLKAQRRDIGHRRRSSPMLAFEPMPGKAVTTGTRGRSLDVVDRPAPTALTAPSMCGVWAALHARSIDSATKRKGDGVQSSRASVTSRRHFGFASVYLIVGDCRDNQLSYSDLCSVFRCGTWRHVPCFDQRQTVTGGTPRRDCLVREHSTLRIGGTNNG